MAEQDRPSLEFGTTNNTVWVSGPPTEPEAASVPPKDRDFARALLDASLVAVPLALGYFAGIAYLDAYLSAFSISIHEVDAPLATIVAHSYTVFTHAAFLWKTSLVLLALFFGAVVLWQAKHRKLVATDFPAQPLAFGALLVAGLLIFIAIKASAEETARTAAHRVWNDANAIVIPRKSLSLHDNRLGSQQWVRLEKCLKSARIKHVTATSERSYAICVIDQEGFLITHLASNDGYLPLRHLRPCASDSWKRKSFCILNNKDDQ